MGKPQRGRGGNRPNRFNKKEDKEPAIRKNDLFEADDDEPDEDKYAGQRYDRVDNYEYELPSDFEDEEIDDDEAFNEEDEKMYGHLFAKKGATDASSDEDKEATGDDSDSDGYSDELLDSEEDQDVGNEDEEDDEDYNSDDFSEDELQALRHAKKQLLQKARKQGDESELSSSEEESEDEDDGNLDVENNWGVDQDQDQEDQQDKDDGAAGEGLRPRKRRRDLVHTEAYPESEFNLPTSGTEGELTLTDLIAGLGDSKSKLGAARKDLERMQRKAAPVAVPLPGPIKKRQERKAGYDEAKKDINKWMPIVKANREAPTLRFTADTTAVPRTVTTAALAAKHAPETAMEAEVAALLESAGAHTSKAIAEAEEALALKELTVEEAQERRNKLAKMRALLFYHEVKAKRLRKIKSKDYRRRLKKSEKRRALGLEDGDGDLDADALRQELEDAEYERAKERLTLKHKNTSRFIRRALKRGLNVMDEDTREAVTEQLRLGQELRQKAMRMKSNGGGSDSDNDDGSTSASDTDASDDDDNDHTQKPSNGKMLSGKARKAALDILNGRNDAETAPSGLFALPFMKRALEKQRLQAEEEARAVLEAAGEGDADDGSGHKRLKEQTNSGGARMTFGGGVNGNGKGSTADDLAARVKKLEEAALRSDSDLDSDEDEDADAKAEGLMERLRNGGQQKQQQQKRQLEDNLDNDESDEDINVAATLPGSRAKESTSGGFLHVDLPQRATRGASGVLETIAQGKNKLSQQDHLFKAGSARAEKKAGGAVEASIGPAGGKNLKNIPDQQQQFVDFIATRQFKGAKSGYVFKKGAKGVGYYLDSNSNALPLSTKGSKSSKQQQSNKKQRKAPLSNIDNDDADNNNAGNGVMRPADTSAAGAGLSQEELVRRAFAGDDVVAEFAADKAAEVEGELPKEDVPGALPGWGTWASNQREPKWVADAKRKAQQRKEAAAANRKDAKLQYVIISEKWDKRAAKYRTPSVPYPFDSKETYERAMRQPLGQEYNTTAAFRNLTRPGIIKDSGVIIEPIRYSESIAEHDAKAPKNSRKAAIITVAGGMPKRQKTGKK